MRNRYPPKIPDHIEFFSDGLQEIIPGKIQEVMAEIKDISDRYQRNLAGLKEFKKKPWFTENDELFWIQESSFEYAPMIRLQKWLNYYLTIWSQTSEYNMQQFIYFKELNSPTFKSDTERVEKARLIPIENFYTGRLRSNGSRLLGLCPFHKEDTPSFFIFTDQNRYHCFGCNERGDVISFVMKMKELSFGDALKLL